LLSSYNEKANSTIEEAWAQVLNVSVEELPFHMGAVQDLVREVRVAYEDRDDPSWSAIVGHLQQLAEVIWPRRLALNQPMTNLRPDQTALDYLLAFSSYLHHVASEGPLPEEETLDDLRAKVSDLISSLTEAELEPMVKRLLVVRLSAVLEALDHLDVYGADGARRAFEALGLDAAYYDEAAGDKATMDRIKSVVKKGLVVFQAVVVTGAGGLEIEQRLEHIFNPPPIHQRALPRGSEQEPPGLPSPHDRPDPA
jgi:hypothetical protein